MRGKVLNLLDEPLIRIRRTGGAAIERVTLPELLVLLADDAVASFPALRAHQRFPWHAFLVQLAAIALHQAGHTEPPASAAAWADLLRALTPDHPDDAPWCLVAPYDRPALLQAPAAGEALEWFGRSQPAIETPDGLEQAVLPLITRNHDLKNSCLVESEADDWLFSLVDVQTMSSYSIKYPGVVRMGSGTGTRTCFTIRPPGGVGAWFIRDVRSLATVGPDGRPGLVWLEPWTGTETIPVQDLHPFFIEICRQVRLVIRNHRIAALQRGDAKPRVGDKSTRDRMRGVVDDPWLPIEIGSRNQRDSRDLPAAIAVRGSGLGYALVVKMLDPELVKLARLASVTSHDVDEGLYLCASSVAHHYKQSKTEGYHERRIPISKAIKRLLSVGAADQIAAAGRARVELAGELAKWVLRPALYCLLRDGKEAERLTSKQRENLDRQADGWLARLDHEVDTTFFSDLWREFETEDAAERERMREDWLQGRIEKAAAILGEACRAVPLASIHRYRARTRAKGLFWYLARKQFPQLYPETTDATATA
jgi:CRISPR system Cascade subunit CasA